MTKTEISRRTFLTGLAAASAVAPALPALVDKHMVGLDLAAGPDKTVMTILYGGGRGGGKVWDVVWYEEAATIESLEQAVQALDAAKVPRGNRIAYDRHTDTFWVGP